MPNGAVRAVVWRLEGVLRDSLRAAILAVTPLALVVIAASDAPSYNFDVRPILAEQCFDCHGPDANARKAGLRLDDADSATARLPSGHFAILPGNPDASMMVRRIAADHPDLRMPPPETGRRLSDEHVAIIRAWVESGARYEAHWAYVAPERPRVPDVQNTSWPRNAIDYIVLAHLEKHGLSPAQEADPYTLIRRLSFDLTGLPPSIEDAEAFVHDARADRVAWAVDRLLASPAYGEHMGRMWLDLARYADSNGYHIDTRRTMWAYRDWVISAFNRNLPFDQFTIEQIAGDLLPDPTLDQRIASGFHRNTMFNEEGGIDAEEFRTKAVFDRVDTTMNVWMGTTMGCAQCHDHKYDSFTQEEYYRLFAFFNSVPELGGGTGQSMAPLVHLPLDPRAQAELDGLHSVIASLQRQQADQDMQMRRDLLDIAKRLRHADEWVSEEQEPLTTIPALVREALETDADAWTDAHRESLLDYWRTRQPERIDLRIAKLQERANAMEASRPTSLIMAEMDTPRETHVLLRGDFLTQGKRVTAGVPAVLHTLHATANATRLDLAHWLIDSKNPLVARVTVNRLWAMVFGRGIVATLDDFGTRGALPSHPDLLDYLASEFMASGWDIKALLRLMVTSATYRQTSHAGPGSYARDPDNVHLARGPRFRLDAEGIRDNALAVSGLLVTAIGGPPAYPYQPPGLYEEKIQTGYDVGEWPEAHGDALYRRGVYTFRRRSVPYPTFQTFDAPSFEYCTAQRPRTNTPLQALATLNDPQFVEAARVLAEQLLQTGTTTEERLNEAIRRCLTRPAEQRELDALAGLYAVLMQRYTQNPSAAQELIHVGRAPRAQNLSPVELAVWTVIANVLLNLDETITKG